MSRTHPAADAGIIEPADRALRDLPRTADWLASPVGRDDEHTEVDHAVHSIHAWARRHLDSPAIDAAKSIPAAVTEELRELGLFGMTIPTEYGGSGLSLGATCRLLGELAYFDRSVACCVGLHCGLGTDALLRYGTDRQKARYLPDLASGARLAAFAATEAGAGSHIAAVTTTATPAGPTQLRLTGQKVFVTNGGVADLYTVLARTPGLGGARHGWSLLLVEREDGPEIGREEDKLGMRATSTTPVAFDDILLPAGRVLGEPSLGLEQFSEVLATGRTLMAAACLGAARAAHDRATGHALQREQFGRPIGRFGQIRELICDAEARIYALEALLRLVTQTRDRGAGEIAVESAAIKVLASEAAWEIADQALQIHGGSGFIEDTGVARILRDARVTRIFEGANEVLRLSVARAALMAATKRPSASPADRRPLPGRVESALAVPAAAYDALSYRVDDRLARLRREHGLRLFEHQVLLRGLADAVLARLLFAATILRAEGELRQAPPPARRDEILDLVGWTQRRTAAAIDAALARAADPDRERLAHALSDRIYARSGG